MNQFSSVSQDPRPREFDHRFVWAHSPPQRSGFSGEKWWNNSKKSIPQFSRLLKMRSSLSIEREGRGSQHRVCGELERLVPRKQFRVEVFSSFFDARSSLFLWSNGLGISSRFNSRVLYWSTEGLGTANGWELTPVAGKMMSSERANPFNVALYNVWKPQWLDYKMPYNATLLDPLYRRTKILSKRTYMIRISPMRKTNQYVLRCESAITFFGQTYIRFEKITAVLIVVYAKAYVIINVTIILIGSR